MKGVVNLDEYKQSLRKPTKGAILKTCWIVRKFKSRAEIARQNKRDIKRQIIEESENYVFLAKHCFKEWIKSMRNYDIDTFAAAFWYIWTLLWKIKYNKEIYEKIYETDIDKLSEENRFIKSFLIFLNNPKEPLNISNLKKYLKIISDKWDEDNPEYILIEEYIDFVLEATEHMINVWDIEYNIIWIKA